MFYLFCGIELQLLAACFPNGLSAVKVKQKVENNL
jgi:hypothetical protein